MERVVKPQRAFVHPLWIASLALLVVNDHLLKGAGVLPGWLTGKLSDFAGLVVAPLVLGAVIFASSRASLRWAHVAVGAGFAAIKIFPAAAHAVEALMAVTPLPWTITVDPTDLFALPMLLVSYAVLVPATEQPAAVRPVVERVAFMAGGLACAATSAPNPCREDSSQCPSPAPARPTEQASLVLANTTSAARLVRVRPLRETVIAECGAVMADPTAALSRDLFGPAQVWLLEPGRALPLQNDDCDVYLVDADGLDMTLLAWREVDFPTEFISTSTSFPEPERTINMRLSDEGKLVLDGHAAVFDAPPSEPAPPTETCAVPDSSVGVDWSIAPLSPTVLVGITSSPDGCHSLDFGFTAGYVCAPIEALPFAPGDTIRVEEYVEDQGTTSLHLISDQYLVRIVRGDITRIFGGSTAPSLEISASAEPLPGCASHHDACGSLVTPLELTISGAEGVETTFLRAGQQAAIPAAGATLHLVRAQEMPVRDTECPPFAANAQYIESVYVVEQGAQE